jgi:hypothetical protein
MIEIIFAPGFVELFNYNYGFSNKGITEIEQNIEIIN